MYKTIVVHIDGSPQQESRLRAASRIALDHGAHLVGNAVTGIAWHDYALLAGPVSGVALDLDYEELREAARKLLAGFDETAARLGVEAREGRLVEDDARYSLLLQARYADLIVVSQDSGPEPFLPARVRGLPQHLILQGARPVLVVPELYRSAALPGTAVIGWDGSARAVRAIAAALPLLRRADSVKLVLVNPNALSDLHGDEPGADMALYLARHGVRVEVALEHTRAGAGESLLAFARDVGAGLVVAGAFGHNRYREWMLGGVTRTLLERALTPVLFAH